MAPRGGPSLGAAHPGINPQHPTPNTQPKATHPSTIPAAAAATSTASAAEGCRRRLIRPITPLAAAHCLVPLPAAWSCEAFECLRAVGPAAGSKDVVGIRGHKQGESVSAIGGLERRLTTPGLLGAITHTTQNGECTRVTVASLELQERAPQGIWGLNAKQERASPKFAQPPQQSPAPFCLTTDPTEKKGTCLLVHRFAGGRAGQTHDDVSLT